MIDFNLMVRNILFENPTTPAAAPAASAPAATTPAASAPAATTPAASAPAATTPAATGQQTDNEDQQGANNLIQSITKTNITPLKTAWSQQFKPDTHPFPSDADLSRLVYATKTAILGRIKNASGFPKIEIVFPLIDLIAQLYEQHYKSTLKDNEKEPEKNIYDNFYKKLKTIKRPLEYRPDNAWAAGLKSNLFSISKGELGKLRMDSPEMQSLSIYGVIFKLLEIRKKVQLPFLTDFTKKFNGKGMVDKILLEPWGLVSGQNAVSDEKVKDLYDDASVKEIVDISLAAYKLYQQQCVSHGVEETNHSLYPQFIGQKGAEPVTWPVQQPAEQPQPVNASFDLVLQNAYSLLLNEMVNPSLTDPYDNRQGAEQQTQQPAQPQTPEPDQQQTQQPTQPELKEFQTDKGFLYSYQKIKEAADKFDNQEAESLIKEITDFANYVKKEGERDIMGGLTKIAQGLSLGVKNMGT